MSSNTDFAAMSLANFVLGWNLLLILRQKKILSDEEVKHVLEHALLGLETYQHPASEGDKSAIIEARRLLEQFRDLLGA